MSSKTFLILFAIFGLALVARAELEWDNPVQEVQRTPAEKVEVFHFRFRNSGKAPVTITEARPSCNCTTAKLDKTTYAPGEKGEIVVNMNFYGASGTHHKTIAVTSDDHPDQPKRLDLTVLVIESLNVTPQLVWWRVGEKNEPRKVELTADKAHSVNITGVKSSDPRVSAKLKTLKKGEQYVLILTAETTAEPYGSEVTVQTDYPPDAPRAYPIEARVK